jgi:hypothetical protein
MDAAVAAVATTSSVDAAQQALEAATKDHVAAMETVHRLHTQYETHMQSVLSQGGTVHIAKR